MSPDRPRQDGGIVAAAGQEVAELGLDLVGPGDAADRLHRQHGVEVGPVAQGFETLCRRVQEDAPADQAAVALLEGVEHRPAAGPAAEAGALEVLAYRLEGAAVVGLERQEVVGVPGPDPLGDGLLAAHRVQRDDTALEPQGVEQLGDGPVISFDLPSTARWPSASPRRLAQARAGGSGPGWGRRLPEGRTVLPSTAIPSRSIPSAKDCAQRVKQASNASGSMSMNTRRKVSCEGMPFGRARKVPSQACLLRP